MSSLSVRIKELRKEKKLTQEAFGALFGIKKSTVSMYENGNSSPDDELKGRIADYFDVSIDYLLGRSNKRCFEFEHTAFHTTSLDGLDESDIILVENLIKSLKEKHKK